VGRTAVVGMEASSRVWLVVLCACAAVVLRPEVGERVSSSSSTAMSPSRAELADDDGLLIDTCTISKGYLVCLAPSRSLCLSHCTRLYYTALYCQCVRRQYFNADIRFRKLL
jgi:hypothetical protein